MEDYQNMPDANTQPPAMLPAPQENLEQEKKNRALKWIIIAGAVLVIALLVLAIYALLQPGTPTDRIRDVFIIFMALESLVIGVALIILVVQLAVLINLIQNELKPILNSTNETVNTLRGTVTFLSNNLAEPVIKLNEYIAVIKRLTDIFRPGR